MLKKKFNLLKSLVWKREEKEIIKRGQLSICLAVSLPPLPRPPELEQEVE